ncbi:integral membrane protein MviN [Dethiosulfovibrio peptidovorans DSM 11002]|uniref:Probable lipid II flippase MurJ n=1 Tax=Dethiosulfovibrio peptidovorans DSM 11002 TaxID=469381 RepID=D2Z8W6_9BACT|nr:integral membrane protein MviN [Dethiosulfovibrio peptidovorans DSM 11002]
MSVILSRMVRNALTMMLGTFASRILGLAREIITAALFGASRSLDAFYIAYTLANLARQLLAEGALSAAFVPVFAQVLEKDGCERAENLARQASSVLLFLCAVVVVLGYLMSPLLVSLMAPGFDVEKTNLAVSLTRWMFPYLMMVSMAALAMGVLNSMGRFFVPAVAPAMANVAYITIVLLFASRSGVSCLVWAVLLGGVLQMGIQLLAVSREGVSLLPAIPRKGDPELRRMMLLFLPYAAGLSLNQINPIISRVLGSFLQDGAISVLNYANRVIQLPLGLVVIAISQAVLPELSRCLLEGDRVFSETVRDSVRFALFAILPITVAACIVSGPVIHVLFYRGAFDEWAWNATSLAMSMYALGLPGMACSTVIMRALYAKGLPRAAVAVTVSSVVSNLVISVLLLRPMGFSGLALATSIAFTLSSFVGLYLLSRKTTHRIGLFDVSWIVKNLVALSALTVALYGLSVWYPYPQNGSMAWRSLWILLAAILGGAFYIGGAAVMGSGELRWIKEAVVSKKGKGQKNRDKSND